MVDEHISGFVERMKGEFGEPMIEEQRMNVGGTSTMNGLGSGR